MLRALHEQGIKVPGQCSVASFGCQPMHALHIPALTEVGTPYGKWSESVVQLLSERFSKSGSTPLSKWLPAKLFVRESTAKRKR